MRYTRTPAERAAGMAFYTKRPTATRATRTRCGRCFLVSREVSRARRKGSAARRANLRVLDQADDDHDDGQDQEDEQESAADAGAHSRDAAGAQDVGDQGDDEEDNRDANQPAGKALREQRGCSKSRKHVSLL